MLPIYKSFEDEKKKTAISKKNNFIKILFIYFWKEGKGEKEKEKHQCTKDNPRDESQIHYFLYAPNWGPRQQPCSYWDSNCQPVVCRPAGWHSTH